MGHRVVEGLQGAEPGEGPGWTSKPAKGPFAMGLRYEVALASALPAWQHGPWFRFWDHNGMGWCQPDLIRVNRDEVLVLEAKYTWVPEGRTQLERLYLPVLEKVFARPVRGILVCKTLSIGCPRPVATLSEALVRARSGQHALWQWLPKTPVWAKGARDA